MNEQPEALRLADAMLNYWDERGPDAEAVAVELRRLHELAESEGRWASDYLKRAVKAEERIAQLEAALRQAVSALAYFDSQKRLKAIAAAKQALGEQT